MAVAATAVARLSWPSSGAPLVVLVPVPVPLAGSHAAMPGTDLKHGGYINLESVRVDVTL